MKTKVLLASGMLLIAGGVYFLSQNHRDRPGQGTEAVVVLQADSTRSQDRKRDMPPDLSRWQGLTDDTLSREARLDIARSIDASLAPAEVAHLFDLLGRPGNPGRLEEWWVIVNEIMEQMRKKGIGADDYADRMTALIHDPACPMVTRDYAIQHLSQWLAPVAADVTPREQDPEKIRAGLAAIAAAIRNPSHIGTTLPGTGLLSLADASARLDKPLVGEVWSGLRPFLTEVLEGRTAADVPLRVSVIQAVARTQQEDYLPMVRAMAQAQGQNPSIRLSSISALGFYRKPEDRALLAAFASAPNPFQYAARSALASYDPQ